MRFSFLGIALSFLMLSGCFPPEKKEKEPDLKIPDQGEYLTKRGLDVLAFNNQYPQGHQSGVEIIQHGERIATNGDLRLGPIPGQWSPVPAQLEREVNTEKNIISTRMAYPDSGKNRKGFNPITYPDLHFTYEVQVSPASKGDGFIISVDLNEPLPQKWAGKAGFNLELFPGLLYGKAYQAGNKTGVFPRNPAGLVEKDSAGNLHAQPMDSGRKLIIAPGSEKHKFTIENLKGEPLKLYDSRVKHNNGWFVIRSTVEAGETNNAIQWKVTPEVKKNWKRNPVIQVSQHGYHPKETKEAIIEADTLWQAPNTVFLKKVTGGKRDSMEKAVELKPWGQFLRYNYYTFDFSDIQKPGLYYIELDNKKSHHFRISDDIYSDNLWQPTLDYFLPVQMCHMKVREKYRTWHGRCHLDDALMAPVDTNHFDGYKQGTSTLTGFQPYQHVPGLNQGGWHDAGDYDMRIESQTGTIHGLALLYENFKVRHDKTMIDQENKVTEIRQPDGKADILQQIEHGLLSVVKGYDRLGRLYRGIICNNLRQYVLLGDGSTMTDNQPDLSGTPGGDDRWVFTENNASRALNAAQGLAAAGRVMEQYDSSLAGKTTRIAGEIFDRHTDTTIKTLENVPALMAAVELYKTTGQPFYIDMIKGSRELLLKNISATGWSVSRIKDSLPKDMQAELKKKLKEYETNLSEKITENPYNVPYNPAVWGAGWNIQDFGVKMYFLHKNYPQIFSEKYFLNALQYVLGEHQGANTKSYVSAVGSESVTTAYGINRGDWSYIPGGVISGTGLIKPNFPELKHWPFLWQQTEYVMGGPGTNLMLLCKGAESVLGE